MRNIKTMWSITTLCCISCWLVTFVGSEVSSNGSVNRAEVDGIIWKFLLDKYSTSGDSLSPSDLANMVHTMSKCGNDSSNVTGGSQPPKSPSVSCNGIPPLDFDSKSRTFSNLSSLSSIFQRVLFFADNPACCDSKLLVDDKQNLVVGPQSETDVLDGSTFAVDSKNKREKPTSGEGESMLEFNIV